MKYREQMFPVLVSVGLEPRYPVVSNNYVFMPFFVPQAHVGVSVTRWGLRVTLNLRNDVDRKRFKLLFDQRERIDKAIGMPLDWGDEKEWRQKSVVRAALDGGYESDERTWSDQHNWAANTARRFEDEFAVRLS